MRLRSLVLAISLAIGAGIPAMAAAKYKPPKQPRVKNVKSRRAGKAAAKPVRPKTPKRPKVKIPKHHKAQ